MVVKDRKDYVHEENLGEPTPDRFYLGNCMGRYQVIKTLYCNYNDLTIAGGTKDENKYGISPRIIIRRTGDSLCCTILEKRALTESTLYSCIPISKEFHIKFLLTILNSKLYTYFIRRGMITNKQAFPQVLMTDLQLLPISETPLSNQKQFIEKAPFGCKSNVSYS